MLKIFLDIPVIAMILKILSIQAIKYAADTLIFDEILSVKSTGGGGGANPSVRHFSTLLAKRVKCSKLWVL